MIIQLEIGLIYLLRENSTEIESVKTKVVIIKAESDIVKPDRSVDHHFAFDFVYKYLLNQIRMNGQLSDEYLKKLKEMSSDDLQSLFLQIIDIENEVTKLEKEETQMKRNNVSTF